MARPSLARADHRRTAAAPACRPAGAAAGRPGARPNLRAWAAAPWLALALGCGPTRSPAPVPTPAGGDTPATPAAASTTNAADAAAAGLAQALAEAPGAAADPQLRTLLTDHWAATLARDPVFATSLAVHAYDDRLPATGPAASAAARQERDALLARARALAPLTGDDALTLRLFIEELEGAAAADPCRFEEWTVSTRDNPVAAYNYLPKLVEAGDPAAAAAYLARVQAVPTAVDGVVASLRAGAAEGLLANAESIRRTIAMVDQQLAEPLAAWPLMEPASDELLARWEDATAATRYAAELRAAVDGPVRAAFVRYRDLLRDELLPRARGEAQPGLAGLPVGPACYAGLVRANTTLPRTAREVHAIGLAEIRRIDRELAALGRKRLGTKGLRATLAALRGDPAVFFTTSEEVEAAAVEALALAKTQMPRAFGRLPQADCVVTRIPDYEAPFTTIAYYRQPHPDGSKPGEYFINVHAPTTRPRFEARVLAVHEAIPGHHLQIAIAQELPALPAFRKHGGMTVFVEGWALYTERMAEELGMYRDDLDRLGVLSFDAWRASRLVVDTGLHELGWTRAQAEQFMLEHTALAPNNIANEVDRYIVWPGQALAYKTGQLEIWALRREAEAALGERFELAAFHDVVLGAGAVSLGVLRERVEAWIASAP